MTLKGNVNIALTSGSAPFFFLTSGHNFVLVMPTKSMPDASNASISFCDVWLLSSFKKASLEPGMLLAGNGEGGTYNSFLRVSA